MTSEVPASIAPNSTGSSFVASVRKNSIIMSLCRFLGLLIGIFVTPVIVKELGPSLYGLYSVLLSSATTLGSFDFGLAGSFLKHINEYLTRGDVRCARATVSAAVLFYVGLSLLFIPLGMILAPWLVGFIKIGSEDRHLASTCLVLAIGYVIATGFANIPSQVVTAMHRIDLVSVVGLASQIIGQTIAIVLILSGYGIMGIIVALYIQVFIGAIANLVIAYRLIGWPFGTLRALTRAELVKMVKYGGWMQLAGLTGIFQSQSDKIVIGAFVNLTSVTAYEIGNKIALLGRTFPLTLCAAAFPAISSISTMDDRERLINAYVKSSNMLALVTMFFTSMLIGGAEHIILVWMGHPIADSSAILCMLVISFAVNNLTGIGTAVLRAQAKLKYETSYGWLQLVINVVVSIVLGIRYGLYGIVTGTLVGAACGSIYFLVIFHKMESLGWWNTVGKTLTKIVVISLISSLIYRLLLLSVSIHHYASRVHGLLLLVLFGVIYVMVFALGSSLWIPECVESVGKIGRKANGLLHRRRSS